MIGWCGSSSSRQMLKNLGSPLGSPRRKHSVRHLLPAESRVFQESYSAYSFYPPSIHFRGLLTIQKSGATCASTNLHWSQSYFEIVRKDKFQLNRERFDFSFLLPTSHRRDASSTSHAHINLVPNARQVGTLTSHDPFHPEVLQCRCPRGSELPGSRTKKPLYGRAVVGQPD